MTEWDNLTEEQCAEVLGFLREKSRQYGFQEMDEVLGMETDQAETPSAALRAYRQGFADYLTIFSEESLEATRKLFYEALGYDQKVPFRVVLNAERSDREREINLEEYRKCWSLRDMLGHGVERPGPDKPRDPSQGMGR